MKQSLFPDGMSVYVENTKESIKKTAGTNKQLEQSCRIQDYFPICQQ